MTDMREYGVRVRVDIDTNDVKELLDLVERLGALIEQLMQIAHGNALFNGGFGDRDPMVGFSLIMAEWDRICAENDRYEAEVERLTAELGTEQNGLRVAARIIDTANAEVIERDQRIADTRLAWAEQVIDLEQKLDEARTLAWKWRNDAADYTASPEDTLQLYPFPWEVTK